MTGILTCGGCAARYPIVNGVPVLLDDVEDMAITQQAFSKQWTWQNLGKFENETIFGKTADDEFEVFKRVMELDDFRDLDGKCVLDAGCGSGRLTKNIGELAANATVFGIDISESAWVAFNRSKDLKNVHIIQCDFLNPPFRSPSFDYVWSEGVIHHTPSCVKSFHKLSELVNKRGKIYIWIYHGVGLNPYRWARRLLWKPYLLSPGLRYTLSWMFAIALYPGLRLLEFLKITKRRRELKMLVFNFFDNLSPEFQHYHSEKEVYKWFTDEHYTDIKLSGKVGAAGRKP